MLSVFSIKTSAKNKFNTREQPITMCVTMNAKLAAQWFQLINTLNKMQGVVTFFFTSLKYCDTGQ